MRKKKTQNTMINFFHVQFANFVHTLHSKINTIYIEKEYKQYQKKEREREIKSKKEKKKNIKLKL